MEACFTFRTTYRDGAFVPEEPEYRQLMRLADLRARVCMAQGNPREIPAHTLTFIESSDNISGDATVAISATKTEVLNSSGS